MNHCVWVCMRWRAEFVGGWFAPGRMVRASVAKGGMDGIMVHGFRH
jgi:hypothetical protein